jgi:hypothetical protein
MTYQLAQEMWNAWSPKQRAEWAAKQSWRETAEGFAAVSNGDAVSAANHFAAAVTLQGLHANIIGRTACGLKPPEEENKS